MTSVIINEVISSGAIGFFCSSFKLCKEALKQVPLHPGSANLVFHHNIDPATFLRISFREERDRAMIDAELRFVDYLARMGVPCARPVPAASGDFCVEYQLNNRTLKAALFTEASGSFLHHKQYRMPEGVSLTKFWRKLGEIIGKMHALSANYVTDPKPNRFIWLDRHYESLPKLLPGCLEVHQEVIRKSIDEIGSIPVTPISYGLCHNDLGIINLKIDYSNDNCDITVFDFDDCGYNYFMYDLAWFWEFNTGWAMNLEPRSKWRAFMDRCFQTMLEEYLKHHDPGIDIVASLPVLLKANHIENILEPLRDLIKLGKPLKLSREMKYHIHCLKYGIEYLGFFDDVFDVSKPFSI